MVDGLGCKDVDFSHFDIISALGFCSRDVRALEEAYCRPDEDPPPQVHGYLAHKKQPPPEGFHRALDIVLLKGARVGLFLMSEVSLYGEILGNW